MKRGQKQTIKTDKAYFLTLTVVGWNVLLKCRRITNPAERSLIGLPICTTVFITLTRFMQNSKLSLIFFIVIILFCQLFHSCTYATIPRYIKKQFCIYNNKDCKIDTNLIFVNKGYYRDVKKFYRPSKTKFVNTTNNLHTDSMLKSDNDISDYDILFFDNGLCMEGKQINSLLEGKYLWKSGDWGAYKIYNDTIKVKTINRGSMNAGIWAEEKWYKIKNKNELQILHIKRLDNFDFYNPLLNHNIDSIHYYPSEYHDLKNHIINPNYSWLLNKKWFWQNKADYKAWKKNKK